MKIDNSDNLTYLHLRRFGRCSYARLSLLNIVCISVLTLLPDYMNGLLHSLHRKVITFVYIKNTNLLACCG